MAFIDIFLLSLYLGWFMLVATALGNYILGWLRWQDNFSMTLALSYNLGFAVTGYGLVLLGLVGQFNRISLSVFMVVLTSLCIRRICVLLKLTWQHSLVVFCTLWQKSRWLLLILLIGGGVLLSNYLACFAPPTARDALAYHLPEANAIIANQRLIFPLGGHIFYGNIPVFMEVMYAGGIIFGDDSLGQLLHYSLYLAFVVFVYGWLRKHYNLTTAIFGVVGIQLLHDLTTTAISLNIDTAHMVLEAIAVLLVIDWVHDQNSMRLRAAGAILGLALSMKYSPLATVGLLSILILITTVVQRYPWRKIGLTVLQFAIPIMTIAGFWYMKNGIFLHNPLYPFYFGHSGYDEVQFQSLISAVQDFHVPRTVLNWLRWPYVFYWRGTNPVSVFALPQFYVVLTALACLPLILGVNRQRLRHALLISYALAYSAYWFFLATHQIRFLDPANIIFVILAIIGVTQLPRAWGFKLLALGSSLIIISFLVAGHSLRTIGNLGFVGLRTYVWHWPEFKYTVGLQSRAQYLSDYLDCGLETADYLESNTLSAAVLDNWTAWHNYHFQVYMKYNQYYSLPPDLTPTAVHDFLQQKNIHYVYFNQESKTDFSAQTDPTMQTYYAARIQQENDLLANARLAYQFETCQLYELAP